MAHKTALGLAALALYLRLFLDPNHNSPLNSQRNIIKLLLDERTQYDRRNNPPVIHNNETLFDIIKDSIKTASRWIPYFNHSTEEPITVTEVYHYEPYLYFILIFSILILFLLIRRICFNNCVRGLVNQFEF